MVVTTAGIAGAGISLALAVPAGLAPGPGLLGL